ncbi:MAG: hypothetical protein ACI8RZ_001816 [Myxococcota bacterium]
MLILLALSAHAATTMVLPDGEDPTDWQAAVSMAGLTLGAATGAAHVTLGGGQLCAVLPPDRQRCVALAMPQTDAAREEAVWLARSLLREVQAMPAPEPEVVPPVSARPPPVVVVPQPTPEPIVLPPEPLIIPPPDRAVIPIALSPVLRWRSDSGLAPGGTLSVMLPTTQAVQPLLRLTGVAPDRINLDGPERQTAQLGASLGVRWQHDGPTAALDAGLDWQRWHQDGTPIATAWLPQVTARLGWSLRSDSPLSVQPWLGGAVILRSISMSIDGEPIDDPARLSGLLGLSVERSGR